MPQLRAQLDHDCESCPCQLHAVSLTLLSRARHDASLLSQLCLKHSDKVINQEVFALKKKVPKQGLILVRAIMIGQYALIVGQFGVEP